MKNIWTIHKFIASTAIIVASILTAHSIPAAERYSVQGMVLKVDRPQKSFLVSHDSIPGFMQAMTMPFDVRDVKELDGLAPGVMVEFTLVVDRNFRLCRKASSSSLHDRRTRPPHRATVETG